MPELRDVAPHFIYESWKMSPQSQGYAARLIELSAGHDRFLETAKAFLKVRTAKREQVRLDRRRLGI